MTLRPKSILKTALKIALVFSLLVGALQLSGSPASAEGDPTPYSHQVIRLYRTTLGREPDAGGLSFWTTRLMGGDSVQVVAAGFLASPEGAATTSGDWIIDAYGRALARTPDVPGYAFWAQRPMPEAVVAISDSPEHVRVTGTLPPPPPVVRAPLAAERAATPAGWVDAGHGVFVPPVLLRIRQCESRNNYLAANRFSSARGAYQFLRSSWQLYGHSARYGVAEAHHATPAQQDEAAVLTWQRSGSSPWNASAYCWR